MAIKSYNDYTGKEIKYNEEDLKDHYGISAVIKNEKGEILMQKHVKYGFWTIPVGKVKLNGDIIEGLKQEVMEECNIKVEEFKELARKDYLYIRNGKKVNVYVRLFEITRYSGVVMNNEPKKHSIQNFFSIGKIMKLPYLGDTTILYLDLLGFKRKVKI